MSNIRYLNLNRPRRTNRLDHLAAWSIASAKMDALHDQWTALEKKADELYSEAHRRLDLGLPYVNTPLAQRLEQIDEQILDLVNQCQVIHDEYEIQYGEVLEELLNWPC